MSHFEIRAICPRCGHRYWPDVQGNKIQNEICHACQRVVDRATVRLEGDPEVDLIDEDDEETL